MKLSREQQFWGLLLISIGSLGLAMTLSSSTLTGIFGISGLVLFFSLLTALLEYTPLFRMIPARRVWLSTSLILLYIIIHSGVYFFWMSTLTTILITFALIASIAVIYHTWQGGRYPNVKRFYHRYRFSLPSKKSLHLKPAVLPILIMAMQSILLYRFIIARTTDVLQSPWLAFPFGIFIVYGCATFLLLLYQGTTRHRYIPLLLTVFHYMLTFSLAAIVYKLGYGYDPFLHRATERYIFEHGLAHPKTPFYIGQFVTVNTLAQLLPISIKIIDIWLVPILGSIIIPLVTYISTRFGLQLPKPWARAAMLLPLLYPFKTMIATTPHNTANVFTLFFILLIPLYIRYRYLLPLLIFVALAAVVTHPLTGIFAAWMAAGICVLDFVQKKQKNTRWFWIIFFLIGTILTPLLFGIYLYMSGSGVEPLSVIFQHLNNFYSLFQAPYYYLDNPVIWYFDIIYTYRWFIVPIILGFAVHGWWQWRRIEAARLFVIMPIVLLANAFFAATWLSIPNLNIYEQLQYAGRIFHVIPFFFLSFAVLGILLFIQQKKHRWYRIGIFIGLSIAITISWYFTYPQKNPKVNYPGFNVTAADMTAARLIHDEQPSTNYIVLSNIMTAAAAIDQYGFLKYHDTDQGPQLYYSTASGSRLYRLYQEMLYEGQKRETMDKAMDFAGVDTAYFVVSSYWVNFDNIIAGAKQSADSWVAVGDGNGSLLVFRYRR